MSNSIPVWPGEAYPLGATCDGEGTNFVLASEVAERVELCLFDSDGMEQRLTLPERTGSYWHGYVPGVKPGQRYGFRVYGPWDLDNGHRCDPRKLLLDPYAKAIEGQVKWGQAVFSYQLGNPEKPAPRVDSAGHVPLSIVIDPRFDWGGDRRPRTPWNETIIYETHVKGFTMRHPDIPKKLRGTYAGLGHPASVEYLRKLGVTAVEVMPVHQFVQDGNLSGRGLRNYWGYNTIGFFAPHNEYSSSGDGGHQVREFQEMVKALHAAHMEVILDVVYNHSAEGNHMGPTLCFRGIDNAAYYRLLPEDKHYYMDYTGTGNTLNVRHPQVLQLIMDSLRYWVQQMHVDGFRFDLASTLARELHEVDRLSAFFDLIHQDPVLNQVKLIAEPWDVGEGGYQVGNFPQQWSEWNGKYRDCIRDYWRGQDETLAEFGSRLTGSSDLYGNEGRRPYASINFVTCHDGFTLRDLVSYNSKHNEANGEENNDGENHNRSWNCGVEGETDDPEVLKLRGRLRRNFMATLMLSQGVPMISGGDEIGRTQQGNNNAYCQDNEISWYDWENTDQDFLRFTQSVIDIFKQHPVFRRRRWFQGRPAHGIGPRDIAWFRPDGNEMADEDWDVGYAKALAVVLNGQAIETPDMRGRRITDDTFLLVFNPHFEPLTFTLPDAKWGPAWETVIDTYNWPKCGPSKLKARDRVEAKERSLLVLCCKQ